MARATQGYQKRWVGLRFSKFIKLKRQALSGVFVPHRWFFKDIDIKEISTIVYIRMLCAIAFRQNELQMTQAELRAECLPLMATKSMADCLRLIDIYLDYLFEIILKHQHDKVESQADSDALIINQMMFSKLIHIRKLLEGVGFESAKGKLIPLVDPTIIASLVRNIYETVGAFNLIYVNTKTPDEKEILYNLWVAAGLKFRQRFAAQATGQESKEKMEGEKKEIETSIKLIEGTKLYSGLEKDDKEKILNRIKSKEFRIEFKDNKVKFLGWQDLSTVMGLKEGFFDNIYTYFSLNSHPSNVSIFQFREMFGKETEAFSSLVLIDMKFCFTLFSIFVADYLKVFPQIKETFEKQSLRDQIMLNFHNKMLRGEEYSINDSYKSLG
jgi:hypothetical protein